VQDRPAGGVLVDQVVAGGLGVAAEVAGDRVEQDAALVGGVAVVVAVGAREAALGVGRAMTDRVLIGSRLLTWRRMAGAGELPARPGRSAGLGWLVTDAAAGSRWMLAAARRGGYCQSTQPMVVASRWS
jgi:hypothetical protein